MSWLKRLLKGTGPGPEHGGPHRPEERSESAKKLSLTPAALSYDDVLVDLQTLVEKVTSGRTPADLIDPHESIYDAGYVDSITGADLLVHVERSYGVTVSEIDLVGRLRSLHALVNHLLSEAAA